MDNNRKLIDVITLLQQKGFHKFSYLTSYGVEPITDFTDHYQYCNIVCQYKERLGAILEPRKIGKIKYSSK